MSAKYPGNFMERPVVSMDESGKATCTMPIDLVRGCKRTTATQDPSANVFMISSGVFETSSSPMPRIEMVVSFTC